MNINIYFFLQSQMNNFLLSTNSQQDIQTLDTKIHETVETINSFKTNREFYLSFAKDPQQFIQKWLISQVSLGFSFSTMGH